MARYIYLYRNHYEYNQSSQIHFYSIMEDKIKNLKTITLLSSSLLILLILIILYLNFNKLHL